MTRRGSWAPLAARDPIGGDVGSVEVEGRHYQAMAQQIQSQVRRLREIGSAATMLGDTADKLRDCAQDLAGKLDDAHGRFEAVGSALSDWAPHLQSAQDETWSALQQAQEAQRQQSLHAPPPAPSQPPVEPPSDADVAAQRRREAAYDAAGDDLAAARRRFEGAVEEHQRAARQIAARIENGVKDGLTDSRWEKFKNFVTEHAELISQITEVLSWIATALAVVCLFIPGLNILAILALGFTLATLAGHTVLASTGNGSWFDVALDVFAIATLGVGKVASRGIEGVQVATRKAGTTAARKAASRRSATANRKIRTLERSKSGASSTQRAAINQRIAQVRSTRGPRPGEAARAVRDRPMPSVARNPLTRMSQSMAAGGSADDAVLLADIARTAAGSSSPAVAAAAAAARNPVLVARTAYGAGSAADLGDKVLGSSEVISGKPYSRRYVAVKDSDFFTHESGGTW